MRHIRPILLSLISLTLATFSDARFLAAQNYLYGTGAQTWGVNIPVEDGFINVANGEIHLEIPIATLPQRGGLPLSERLEYDSRIWQLVSTGSSVNFEPTNVPVPYSGVNPTCTGNPPAACTSNTPGTITQTNLNVPNSMAGWRFVQGSETGIIQEYLSGEITDLDADSYWNWGWTDPSGTNHMFSFTTGTVWCPTCGPSAASGYAVDGSGFYLSVTNYTTATVFDSSGNEVYPQIVDRNGNTLTTNSSGALVDTLGRTPVSQSTSGNTTTYSVLTIGGATKTFTVTTETINVHTAFGQSGVNEYSGTLTAIQSITLPDGSSYSFTYDSGTASGNYGELESITLPTGGTISLTYGNYLDSYQNENRWLSAYNGGDASYSFSPQVITQCSGQNEVGCQEQMTVSDGENNNVVYLLTLNNGAWNTQMDYYNNGKSRQHVMSTSTTYNYPTPCTSFDCIGAQWITAAQTLTTLSDTGQMAQTKYTYDQPWFGKPTKAQMWDYYTGTPSSTPTKETDYTYGYLVNNAAYVTQVNVTQVNSANPNGSSASETQFEYDGQTNLNSSCPSSGVQPTTGLPNHQAVTGARGNLTCVIRGISGNPTNPVITSSSYDDAGSKLSDTDGRGNTTGYGYACSDAYLQTATYPISVNGQSLLTKSNYDCSSGLVTSTQDMNGVVNNASTTYSYFLSGNNIGRLQTILYPVGGGSTTYSYPSTTELDQIVAQNSSTNLETKSIVDSYGWPYQSVTVAPEGAITSEVYWAAGALRWSRLFGQFSPIFKWKFCFSV
jgi:hypothetical protein